MTAPVVLGVWASDRPVPLAPTAAYGIDPPEPCDCSLIPDPHEEDACAVLIGTETQK